MKIAFSLLISLPLLLFASTLALSQLCQIRPGSCSADEICILSMWNITNSHAAECGYYTNYSLCCGAVRAALINTTAQAQCVSPYNPILSINNTTNAHVAELGYYDYKVCVDWLNCTIEWNSCTTPAEPIASLNNTTNSHIANFTDYDWKLCCGECDTGESFCNSCFQDNVLAGKCYSLPCWNLSGELPGATACCGDDAKEFKIVRMCAVGVCDSNSTDDACCNEADSCTYNSVCYRDGFSGDVDNDGIEEECDKGVWILKAPLWKILWRDIVEAILRILWRR